MVFERRIIKFVNVIALAAILIIGGCSSDLNEISEKEKVGAELTGDYLGQSTPGDASKLFAPGIISTGLYERDIAVTKDGNEIYFCMFVQGYAVINVVKRVNGSWSEPEIASFSKNSDYFFFEPALSPDDSKIYFLTTMPSEGQESESGWANQNIGLAERNPDGSWGEPRVLEGAVNDDNSQYFPSLTNDGTLYYTYSSKEPNEQSIYRCRLVDGQYNEPEPLPENVNGDGNVYNACIAPDESYLIACVAGREGAENPQRAEFCVFFRTDDDKWSKSILLGKEINPEGVGALSPALSRDGKYFFFSNQQTIPENRPKTPLSYEKLIKYYHSPQNGLSDVYWISTSVIENLRPVSNQVE